MTARAHPEKGIACAILLATVLLTGACIEPRQVSVEEQTPLDRASGRARRASGPIVTGQTRAFRNVDRLSLGPGTLGALQEIRLRVANDVFYADPLGLALIDETDCADGSANCFSPRRTRQVYHGVGTVSWLQQEGGGTVRHSSVTDVRLIQEYTVSDDPADLQSLDCYEPGDTRELICTTLLGSMFNPLPLRRPDIRITARTTDPLRIDEDPADFAAGDAVLVTRRIVDPLVYYEPRIRVLPVTRQVSGDVFRYRVRAAVDVGTVEVTEIALYYSTDPSMGTIDFIRGATVERNPVSGLAEACLAGVQLGGPADPVFSAGAFRYFWDIEYVAAGGVAKALQSELVDVEVGADMNAPPTVPPC